MASGFVGLRVRVVLKPPYARQVEGLVTDIQDQKLFLQDVSFPDGTFAASIILLSTQIEDISIVPSLNTPTHPQPLVNSHGNQVAAKPFRNVLQPSSIPPKALAGVVTSPAEPRTTQHKSFNDPAILSVGRPSPSTTPQLPLDSTGILANITRVASPRTAGGHTPLSASFPSKLQTSLTTLSLENGVPEIVTRSSEDLNDGEILVDGSDEKAGTTHKGRHRAGRKRRAKGTQVQAIPVESSPEVAKATTHSKTQRPDGWRQTPILQEQSEAQPPASLEPKASSKAPTSGKKSRHQRNMERDAYNGFATEDATDIQELGEFDFVGNLSKFDKKTVFESIRKDDTTADEDLLVSHNRMPRPGTFGETKLHPTDNVLSHPRVSSKDGSKSYVQDSDDSTADAPIVQRALSRSLTRRPTRKNSAKVVSDSSAHVTTLEMPAGSSRVANSYDTASPRGRPSVTGRSLSSSARVAKKGTFRYADTGRTCPCVDPLIIQESDSASIVDLSLTEDIIAECAGRSIAEIALSAISPDGRRFNQSNHNAQPVIVVLLGDERVSARALVAARHLQNRGVDVICSALDKRMIKYRSEDWNLTAQIDRLDGEIMTWADTSEHLKTLDAPPELVIDALGGLQNLLEEIQDEPQHVIDTAFAMIAWANKSRAAALAIDCPFGIDPSTGAVEVHEGEPAEIRAKLVACCGAPVTGLLEALRSRRAKGSNDEWRIYVCDVGINHALIDRVKAHGARGGSSKGVSFGATWKTRLVFDDGDTKKTGED